VLEEGKMRKGSKREPTASPQEEYTKSGLVRKEENAMSQAYKLKRDKFFRNYVRTANARASAIAAGCPPASAHAQAQRLLWDPWVQEQLVAYYAAQRLSVESAAIRLSEQVRADYAPYINEDGSVDIRGLREAGLDHLIKSVDIRNDGSVKVEFYDAQKAMELYMKLEGRIQQASVGISFRKGAPGDEAQQIVVYLPENGRDVTE
jgi:hypothetical protein